MTEAKLQKKSGESTNALTRYFRTRHDPLTSLLLTTPVFLVYHIGVLFTPVRNGVDLFTDLMVRLSELSQAAYGALVCGIALAIAIAAYVLRKRGTIHPAAIGPVILESAVWAVLLWLGAGWTTAHVIPGQTGPRSMGVIATLVTCAGAGFHEELVFRVGVFAGGTFALTKLTKLGKSRSALIMGIVSAILFSLAHYIGPYGDTFLLTSFVFRLVMGLLLAGIYQWRGFAVAVYAHALYDVLCFFVLLRR
ncbi:MAG: CPBP family intramembrane metalloprotease [Sandaracinaceae bacterium]|nr:CPBP family intramembrane metalloprotease [Sandaracinaceae bacterium]